MNKLYIGLILGLAFIVTAEAKEGALKNGVAAGFQINQYQDDFGLGMSLTSPYVKDLFAVRVRGNLMFNENTKSDETNWDSYFNFTAGLVGVAGTVCENIRLYGEGGFIGIVPASEFSDKDFVAGGYGVFGFEFFMDARRNYFIELGGVGTGAREDNVPGRPIYSNGLLISAGFRGTF
ncbi:MAG: hypothetical protein KA248_02665 [Kiritimatiellae bacterium]|nr:hypothetical protein [Kiritimatiellia bacterium]